MRIIFCIILFSALGLSAGPAYAQTAAEDAVFPLRQPTTLWQWSTYFGHNAADFNLKSGASDDEGEPVYALLPGVVTFVEATRPDLTLCGLSVDIWHEEYNKKTRLCHLREVTVSVGDPVVAGTTLVGRIDNTGDKSDPEKASSGHHLHLAMQNVDIDGSFISYDISFISWPAFSGVAYGGGGGGIGSPTVGPGSPTGGVNLGPLRLNVDYPSIPVPGLPGTRFDLNQLEENGPLGVTSLPLLIIFIYSASLWIAGIIAFIALVYAGLLYIISGQSPLARSDANQRIKAVFIGIAILLFAVIGLNVINPDLTQLRFSQPQRYEVCSTGGPPECIPRYDLPTPTVSGSAGRTCAELYAPTQDAVNLICSRYSPVTEENVRSFLLDMCGSAYTEDDVNVLFSGTVATCPGVGSVGSTVDGVTIDEHTVANLCGYDDAISYNLGTGELYRPILTYSHGAEEIIISPYGGVELVFLVGEALPRNIAALSEFCASSSESHCLIDGTNITDFTSLQKVTLLNVCVSVLPDSILR